MSRHLSVRIDDDVLTRLDAESHRIGRSRSWLAKRLLDEGLRMERHPGIVFRYGPAGRRPGLVGGPDVWEVVRVRLGDSDGDSSTPDAIAELTGLSLHQVQAALSYYAEHSDEVDHWICSLDEEADRAEAAWRREREFLAG